MSAQESNSDNALDRMVQLARQTLLDARPGDYRDDLADSLPDHPGQLRVRVRASAQKEAAVARGIALRHQPCIEPDLHADSVWAAKPAAGGDGYSGRLDNDHLDDGRRLAVLSLGGRGSSAVFHLGVTGDDTATVDHLDELGEAVIRLGLFCLSLDPSV